MKYFRCAGLLAGTMSLISASSVYGEDSKPNILFIFADDMTYEAIGSLNNSEVKTPNLDRLVERGTSFTQAYNSGSFTAAVCVASRTMLNTGKQLWHAGAMCPKGVPNEKYFEGKRYRYDLEPEPYGKMWSEMMDEAGYETYMSGKWHLLGVDAAKVFEHTVNIRAGMPKQTQERYRRKFVQGSVDTWSPSDSKFGGYWDGGMHWSEVLGNDVIRFLNDAAKREDPFFMYVGFNAPHDPRQSPQKYVDMYPLDRISVPETFMEEYPYCEEIGSGKRLRDEKLGPFPRTEYAVKVNRQEYYAIISHMDEQIGRILDALEKTGQAGNTYIFFTADHGLAVGDHGFMGKQNMYDRSMRVPLIVVGQGVKQGQQVDGFVYLQDVMASALDLAASKYEDQVAFKSLMPLARGDEKKSGYDAIYGAYYGTQRMVRTTDYKMIIYPEAHVVRLYDLIQDPNEMHDLAGDASYRPIMDSLFLEFKSLQKETGDPLDVEPAYRAFFSS
ncbi:sulfatase-like hydrolase/transferase [Poriferisphaera sp. WC338]|uniref:sulfatase-like hydrolase/transferase n=1 Tax=Poriferisphaera sp. WC338 TaxID=3425129 RepID=UPI003D817D3F